jgi:hypothetical protein
MEEQDNWISIESFIKYNGTCSICKHQFSIIQKGGNLHEKIIEDLIYIVHVQNTFDSYTTYKNGIKIDCEILGNFQCKSAS